MSNYLSHSSIFLAMSTHFKCRHPNSYPGEKVERFQVPENKVPWTVEFPEYKPIEFTSQKVLDKPIWADPDIRFVIVNKLHCKIVTLAVKCIYHWPN